MFSLPIVIPTLTLMMVRMLMTERAAMRMSLSVIRLIWLMTLMRLTMFIIRIVLMAHGARDADVVD